MIIFEFMEPDFRGTAAHEIHFMISTRPMDMVTLYFKKTSPSDVIENSTEDGTADINSITNGAITLTFGPMGVETLNGKPFTNEILWFNSSQGGGIFTFDSRL